MKFCVYVEHADGHDSVHVGESNDAGKAAALVGQLLSAAGCCEFNVGVSVKADNKPEPNTPEKPAPTPGGPTPRR